jgi:hypothetical protein
MTFLAYTYRYFQQALRSIGLSHFVAFKRMIMQHYSLHTGAHS